MRYRHADDEMRRDWSRRRVGSLLLGGAGWILTPAGARSLAPGRLPPGVDRVIEGTDYRDGLPRAVPESQGVSSAAVIAFLDEVAASGLELHSFMLMRHGHVVAEGWWQPYRADRIHITHSLTKSVTATAVGLAIAEGHFGLDDRVASFFSGVVPANASANLRAMTVHDLLTMRTGHDHETSGSVWRPITTSWTAEFFKIPVPRQPGTSFVYTSAASYMLSAIISRTTGRAMAEYLRPRLFAPMGIDRWTWDTSPGGVSPGGNGLSWNTSASLKLGALHSAGGWWQGHQLLSADWVGAATTAHVEQAENGHGYGYQWWIGPNRAYFALGLFTQLSIVFPDHDATLSVFGAIRESEQLLPLIWRHFPAAFGSLQTAGQTARALKSREGGLRLLLPLPPGPPRAILARVAGRPFVVTPNDQGVEWLAFDDLGSACAFRMKDANGEHRVVAGFDRYLEQDTSITGNRLHHEYRPLTMRVVAGARWLGADRLEMTWQFVESAFRDTVLCRFAGDTVTIDRRVNLNSAETHLPTLTGRLA